MGGFPWHEARMSATESLALLGSVPVGRIGFTSKALPVIRPVNHIIDDGSIIVRCHEGAAIMPAAHPAEGAVVAYQADVIDLAGQHGWSVVVTGIARLVTDPEEAARYRRLVRGWVGAAADDVVRIRPELVSGIRLTCASGNGSSGDGCSGDAAGLSRDGASGDGLSGGDLSGGGASGDAASGDGSPGGEEADPAITDAG